MNRRHFLRSSGAMFAGVAFSETNRLRADDALSAKWRTFDVTTRVEILKPSGATRVWLPAALPVETPFQKTLFNRPNADGGTARIVQGRADGLGIVTAEFPAGVKPVLTLNTRVATRNYAVDLSVPGKGANLNRAEFEHFRRATKMLPTDGIVKESATEITRGAKTDLEKARLIYEWIVDNTFRDPKTRGCGRGDIRFMLESKDLGGKCADLNALYVGLARARLFGSWEMNWMAYNFAHDVALPGSAGAPVNFLMYPQAETSDGRLDCLDPDSFKYEITAQAIPVSAQRPF